MVRGYGGEAERVAGDDPREVHRQSAGTLDGTLGPIAAIQHAARVDGSTDRARWPMIVLRTPKGWTGPAEIDGKPVEGTWRAHQVPFADVRGNKDHMRMLEDWMRSYRPDELFEEDGRPRADLVDWLPSGDRRMGSNPKANGCRPLRHPRLPTIPPFPGEGVEPG